MTVAPVNPPTEAKRDSSEDHEMDSISGGDITTANEDQTTTRAPLVNENAGVGTDAIPERPRRKPVSYANSVTGEDDESSDEGDLDDDEDDQLDEVPGPIKGFDAIKIYSNLNGQVQHDWELRASTSILVHYLDGGYGPGLAEDVKVIKEDLRSKHRTQPGT